MIETGGTASTNDSNTVGGADDGSAEAAVDRSWNRHDVTAAAVTIASGAIPAGLVAQREQGGGKGGHDVRLG